MIFTGPEPGQQVARSTGLKDRKLALRIAQRWEREARLEREGRKAAQRGTRGLRGSNLALTQAEVAAILRISERAVRNIEKRAIAKFRRHPALRAIWREHEGGEPAGRLVDEGDVGLTRQEIEALMGLAQVPFEQRAMEKVVDFALRDQCPAHRSTVP